MTEKNNENSAMRSKSYLIYMIFILISVQILDTYTNFYNNVIPSKIIEEFLSGYSENVANSIFALCIAVASIGTYFAFLNQYMCDKVGRKVILIFTVFGMGFCSLLLSFSTNIFEYTIYLFLLYIFFTSDIWLIYINEESPPEKRAAWTNIVLMGGIIGAILIPVFRSIYITETSPVGAWRGMTYFSIILGIPLSLLILFTLKETVKYQEIKEERSLGKKTSNTLKKNVKTLFNSARRKEFIVLLIIFFVRSLNYIFIAFIEVYISNSPFLGENDINLIVLIMSLSVVLGYIITGTIADKYGRKPLLLFYSILFPIGLIILIFGANMSEGALIVVCFGAGLANMAYWGLWVLLSIVTIEIVPTDARGTGSGVKLLIGAIGNTAGLVICSIITLYYGLATAFIIFSLLSLIVNVPLIFFFVKETKGIDLSEIV